MVSSGAHVNIKLPKQLTERIQILAQKKMSSFSQVLREAALIGLEKMEK